MEFPLTTISFMQIELTNSNARKAQLFGTTFENVEELAHHKYQVLEDCLYYKLSQDANSMQGKSNAISILPPTVAAGETLDAEILEISLKQLWMFFFVFDVEI
uniref:Uncharacterized protein n=1 Tax=Elaeophora elaphi TaxID=1147741 RepID=A0A0R3S242_9BILA